METINSVLDNDKIDLLEESKIKLHSRIASVRDYGNFIISMNKPPKPKPILKKEVCDAFGISEEDIFKKTRERKICNARQVYVYIIKTANIPGEDPKCKSRRTNLVRLGRHISRDHATIIHSVKVVQNYYDTEVFYKELIDRLQNEITQKRIVIPKL